MALSKLRRRITRANADWERVDYAKRKRAAKSIVIPGQPSPSQIRRILIEEVAKLLQHSGCDVVVVYAFRHKNEVGKIPYTLGRAQVSKDGRGWDGWGKRMLGCGEDKKGEIYAEIVTSWRRRDGWPEQQSVHKVKMRPWGRG